MNTTRPTPSRATFNANLWGASMGKGWEPIPAGGNVYTPVGIFPAPGYWGGFTPAPSYQLRSTNREGLGFYRRHGRNVGWGSWCSEDARYTR